MQIRDLIPWGARGTALARGEDANPFLALQRDINRMFDEFWRRFDQPFGALDGLSVRGAPRTDIAETDKEIEVTIELPGLDQSDVDVSIADDVLTVRGEKKSERSERDRGYLLSERTYGSFFRQIPLPPGIDTEKVNAAFKNGVLTVTLPRLPDAQSRIKRIEVKAA